jgi:hypothetical protein
MNLRHHHLPNPASLELARPGIVRNPNPAALFPGWGVKF